MKTIKDLPKEVVQKVKDFMKESGTTNIHVIIRNARGRFIVEAYLDGSGDKVSFTANFDALNTGIAIGKVVPGLNKEFLETISKYKIWDWIKEGIDLQFKA